MKRNIKRFPKDFMFQLTRTEWNGLKISTNSQDTEIQSIINNRSQIDRFAKTSLKNSLTLRLYRTGCAMLSGVLNSDRAIKMNIAIMRAFVEIRKILLQQTDIKEQLRLIQERISEHDVQLSQIYNSIENLLDEKAAQRKMG
nr:ORF6N domain-containing protein [Terrimonas sp.]